MSTPDSVRYRALVERSPDVIVVLDADWIVTYANETAEARVGHPWMTSSAATRSTSSILTIRSAPGVVAGHLARPAGS